MANSVKYLLRNDTAANWTAKNPILAQGEPGYDSTANRLKFGNAATAWNDLPYVAPDVVNDLTTGGTDKALSAEQGKLLNNNKLNSNRVKDETWTFTLEDDSTVTKKVTVWTS